MSQKQTTEEIFWKLWEKTQTRVLNYKGPYPKYVTMRFGGAIYYIGKKKWARAGVELLYILNRLPTHKPKLRVVK